MKQNKLKMSLELATEIHDYATEDLGMVDVEATAEDMEAEESEESDLAEELNFDRAA